MYFQNVFSDTNIQVIYLLEENEYKPWAAFLLRKALKKMSIPKQKLNQV